MVRIPGSKLILAVALSALLAPLPAAFAAPIYDEAVDGDLSGDRLAPDARVLAAGSSTVSATSVAGDVEYLTLRVPAGLELGSIVLESYVSASAISFIAIQEGTTFTVPATTFDASELLGWLHFGSANLGTDILDDIGVGPGAIGFTPPLGSGDYTFWMQETGPDPASYTLDFLVTPEPTTAVLLAGAVGGLALSRRRRWSGSRT